MENYSPPAITPISSLEKLLIFGLLIAIALMIANNWQPSERKVEDSSQITADSAILKSFNLFAKAVVGISQIASEQLTSPQDRDTLEHLTKGEYVDQFIPTKEEFLKRLDRLSEERKRDELLLAKGQAILLAHLGQTDRSAELIDTIRDSGGTKDERDFIVLAIKETYQLSAVNQPSHYKITPSIREEIQGSLGWIGELLLTDHDIKNGLISQSEVDELYAEAKKRALGIILVIILGSLFLSLGAVFFLIFVAQSFRKKLKLRFVVPNINPGVILLTFVVYLFAMISLMVFLPLLSQLSSITQKLGAQLLFLILTCGVLFVPVFLGCKIRDLNRMVGLEIRNWRVAIREFIMGPVAYLGFLPLLFGVMAIYSTLLDQLGFSVTDGEHPVVPEILSLKGDTSAIIFLILLGVFVAPIIEEIMFRGLLYPWLRTRLNRVMSIFLCGFLFAVIHPQGAIGVLPLTIIGSGLSFLREWRGSLIAPMVAHICNNGAVFAFLLLIK